MDLGGLTSSMTAWNLIGSLLFSGVGFVAFMHGKKQGHFQTMAIGGVLMVYSYFVSNTALMYLAGAALTAALYYYRD